MNNKDKLINLIEEMQKYNFIFSKEFLKDIMKSVTSNIDTFIVRFKYDMIAQKYEDFNRFENIKLNKKQEVRLKNFILYRYEYRKEGNLRVLFVAKMNDKVYILNAFNENAGKHLSKDSYKSNIERAIRIFEKIKEDENNV